MVALLTDRGDRFRSTDRKRVLGLWKNFHWGCNSDSVKGLGERVGRFEERQKRSKLCREACKKLED